VSPRGDGSIGLQAQLMYHELIVDRSAAYRGVLTIAVV
jgi:hypothetical protein